MAAELCLGSPCEARQPTSASQPDVHGTSVTSSTSHAMPSGELFLGCFSHSSSEHSILWHDSEDANATAEDTTAGSAAGRGSCKDRLQHADHNSSDDPASASADATDVMEQMPQSTICQYGQGTSQADVCALPDSVITAENS